MVRAGRQGVLLDKFLEGNIATIGWTAIGGMRDGETLDQLKARMRDVWPNYKPQKIAISASQVFRFAHEIAPGDTVLTYDASRRIYHIGTSRGGYRFNPELAHEHEDGGQIIDVDWDREVSRDALAQSSRNSLGAVSTLFKVPAHVVADIERVLRGDGLPDDADIECGEEETAEPVSLADVEADALVESAYEKLEEAIVALAPDEMEELVAGVLRGMGYKTEVSPKGRDRGQDIIASPDGLGFQDPRIIVEVKHRPGTSIGAPMLRAFLGGRRPGDRCLYVSTGGFTNEARYEAERAQHPTKLLALPDLARLILTDYEALDTPTKALVPLTRVYWPT